MNLQIKLHCEYEYYNIKNPLTESDSADGIKILKENFKKCLTKEKKCANI
jgi:hypothetical protein